MSNNAKKKQKIEVVIDERLKDYLFEGFTINNVADTYINEIQQKYNISKKLAKQVFISSLLYNIVSNTVHEQINYILTGEINN